MSEETHGDPEAVAQELQPSLELAAPTANELPQSVDEIYYAARHRALHDHNDADIVSAQT